MGTLESTTEARKQRLALLRQAKHESLEKRKAQGGLTGNYVPVSIPLQNDTPMDDAQDENNNNDSLLNPNAIKDVRSQVKAIENEIENFANEALEAEKQQSQDVDLFNLAPKKPNWDLKRDLEKKLDKLEKQTQVAIAQLIRDRLKGSHDISDAAAAAEMERKAQAAQEED